MLVENIDHSSFDSKVKSCEEPQFFIPDESDESEDEGKIIIERLMISLEEDDDKMETYMEYVKKMQDMAEETKRAESNMKQFANTIQNMVGSSPNSNTNIIA